MKYISIILSALATMVATPTLGDEKDVIVEEIYQCLGTYEYPYETLENYIADFIIEDHPQFWNARLVYYGCLCGKDENGQIINTPDNFCKNRKAKISDDQIVVSCESSQNDSIFFMRFDKISNDFIFVERVNNENKSVLKFTGKCY